MTSKLLAVLCLFILSSGYYASAQDKIERQHRIRKLQFPSEALKTINEHDNGFKRLKFYREVDTAQKTYTAKFKKARLFYEMNFDQHGKLKSIGFNVTQIDIPEESFGRMVQFLSQNFEKSKIRKIQQLYPIGNLSAGKAIKKAFQNLMVPSMFYKLLVRGKKGDRPTDYDLLFDAEGMLVEFRKSLPANYDRILY